MTRTTARIVLLALAAAVGWLPAHAQDFPNRPVKIVVPWPPGGNVDLTARTVQQALGEALGQQVIVKNRGSAVIAVSGAPTGRTRA